MSRRLPAMGGVGLASPYAIQKRRVTVELLLPGHAARRLDVFLDPDASRPTGFSRPSDLLERHAEFVPAVDPARGTIFLRRESIMALTVPQDIEYDASSAIGLDLFEGRKSREIVVVLEDGRKLRGWMDYVLLQEGARIQEHFELNERFLRIRNGDVVHIIHKSKIVEISIGLTGTE